ncbi:MAG: hypothetical protein AAGF47_05060 [Planctomycetota bacterium]
MSKRTKMLQRFGYYFIGVAIGVLMLGYIQYKRSAARSAQQATAPQPASEAAPSRPATP